MVVKDAKLNLKKLTEKQGKNLWIDIGCGKWKKEGFYGIDLAQIDGVDLVCDLNKGIPLPDNSIDRVFTAHFMEHINDPVLMMEEIWRIMKPGSIAEIRVPHWSNWHAYNPTHKSFWASNSFDIFDPASKYFFYSKASFKILSLKLKYGDFGGNFFFTRMLNNFFTYLLNRNHILSEKFLVKYISAWEMQVILKKVENPGYKMNSV